MRPHNNPVPCKTAQALPETEKPVDPWRMAHAPCDTKITRHAEKEKYPCKHSAHDEFTGLVSYLGGTRGLFSVFGLTSLIRKNRFKTDLFNGICHFIKGSERRQIFHRNPFRGKIHGCAHYARNFFVQSSFDIHGAVGAGHAGDRKFCF